MAEVEILEEAVDALDEMGNDEAESTAHHEIEAEESASEADLEVELDEELAVSDGADMPDDVATISTELGGEMNKHADADVTAGSAADEGMDDLAAAKTARHDDGGEDAVGFVTETEVTSPPVDATDFDDVDLFFSDEGNVATAVGHSSVGDGEEMAATEAASLTADSVGATDEVVHADAHVHVKDTPTKLQPVEKLSAAVKEEADRSITSTMNEVLAKLVEPFTAAKTAAALATTDSAYQVDEL
uniref:Uncharacterized protein n=1 Tax=Peronospora matthiolae TaxID=2874970 RepID=A0AAV1TGK9_9STRA